MALILPFIYSDKKNIGKRKITGASIKLKKARKIRDSEFISNTLNLYNLDIIKNIIYYVKCNIRVKYNILS